VSAEAMGTEIGTDVSVYPYKATAHAREDAGTWNEPVNMDLWFGWVALVLIGEAGIAGIVGSVIVGKIGKIILIVAGILALLSIIIFPAGIQSNLSVGPPVPDAGAFWKELGLFSSGSLTEMGISWDYSSYLSFGFWLALAAAIIAFISSLKHPVAPPPAPPAPPTPEST